jgi:hypothetical protein
MLQAPSGQRQAEVLLVAVQQAVSIVTSGVAGSPLHSGSVVELELEGGPRIVVSDVYIQVIRILLDGLLNLSTFPPSSRFLSLHPVCMHIGNLRNLPVV